MNVNTHTHAQVFIMLRGGKKSSAIVERPHCWMHYSFGQKWKTGSGRQYFIDIIGLIGLKICRIRQKNTK